MEDARIGGDAAPVPECKKHFESCSISPFQHSDPAGAPHLEQTDQKNHLTKASPHWGAGQTTGGPLVDVSQRKGGTTAGSSPADSDGQFCTTSPNILSVGILVG